MAEKRTCPACDSHTSAVYTAFTEGSACPYCGLPAEVVIDLERYARRGVAEEVIERLAKAEQRAADAELAAQSFYAALSQAHAEMGRIFTAATHVRDGWRSTP